MLLNTYSGDTGESTGAVVARESPNDPGKICNPAFATPNSPPPDIPTGSIAVYVNEDGIPPANYLDGDWVIKIDRRGLYWRTDDAQAFYLGEIGVEPADLGLTDIEPVGAVKWGGTDWIVDIDKVTAIAKAKRNGLLSVASMQLAPLSDAQDLNIATPEEISLLAQWRQFRVDLSRIESQTGFPLDIVWPVAPGSAETVTQG